jgi:hypothetical protein
MRRPLLVSALMTVVLSLGVTTYYSTLLPALVATRSSGAAIQGITLVVEQAEAPQARLHFEICGPDVTQISGKGVPLTFAFDTAIHHVTVRPGQTGLMMTPQVAGALATVALAHDPFTPPESWRVAVQLDLAQRPGTGHLTVSPFPTHDFTPALSAAAEAETVILGGRCDDRYATRAE